MEAGDPVTIDPPEQQQGVGATLRARRLELGLSQTDVAAIVKLPPRRIEAMERERWDELPDGPYLRGFLRNVARALNLDAVALVEQVEGSLVRPAAAEPLLVRPGSTHVTLPRRSGPADDRRGGRPLVFGAFVAASIAALIAWSGTASFDRVLVASRSLLHGGTEPRTSTGEVREAIAASDPSRPDAELPAVTAVPAVPGPREPTPATEPFGSPGPPTTPAPSSAATATATAVASSALPLQFHFNQDSWVEVRSASGKVLLQRLNPAGSEQQVQGEAPFTLIVGNAKGVSLQFRGQPVDLAPHTRDSVARLTLS